ncbi:DUF4386 domain-containing protein [Paenibacillus typhae]|uniref:DUF4386 domain-containing protein n=1 Tax=Paenibacillus typhae TaxID=1174501 RepID=UPI001C8D5259|nr:DUF4386 domain-containing protein [Paenibacillus typhae]MBY0010519.1 DUF4386 domain-containing protein [Paenibacillus typhae]
MNNTWRGLTDQRTAALTAGTGLLIMALVAAFSYGYAHSALLTEGNAHATLQNLITHKNLFRAELAGWIIILMLDIIVAWSCYLFLKPVNQPLSLLGAWLRLIYSAILGIAVMNLLYVQLLTTGTEYSQGYTLAQLGVQIMLYLKAFDAMWSVGLIVFGGHLLILGILALQAGNVPRWIAVLLLIASAGYILIHLCKLFLPEYEGIGRILEYIFIIPMSAGELGLGIWLLFRGGKVQTQTG